eukprot:scaffold25019_cov20-Tisochrysis_lutea.AAC.1
MREATHLVPQLVHTGQQGHCSVPHVPGMVDEAVPHLHLRILREHRRKWGGQATKVRNANEAEWHLHLHVLEECRGAND